MKVPCNRCSSRRLYLDLLLAACLSGRALARQEVCGRLEKLPLEESRMIERFNFDLKFVKSIC